MPVESNHAMVLLGLAISGPDSEWIAGDEYEICTLAGSDYGQPEPITAQIASALLDGSLSRTTRHGNREMTLTVLVRALTARGLSRGGLALERLNGKIGELLWTPPLAGSQVSCYQVRDLHITQITGNDSWDLDELGVSSTPFRSYRVTLTALPFALAKTPTAFEATGSGSGTTAPAQVVQVLWSGTDPNPLAEWGTSIPGGTVAFSATRNEVYNLQGAPSSGTHFLYWHGALPPHSPHEWIRVNLNAAGPPLTMKAWEQFYEPTAVRGDYAYYFVGAGFSAPRLSFVLPPGGGRVVREIARTDRIPTVASPRQQQRSVQILGTARSAVSLRIAHQTEFLGRTLTASWMEDGSGYTPALSPYYAVGSGTAPTVADANSVSGSRWTTGTGTITFVVPASRVPEGSYSIFAYARRSTVGDRAVPISVTVETTMGGVGIGDSEMVTRSVISRTVFSAPYEILALTSTPITLPPSRVPAGVNASVRISISAPNPDRQMTIGEVWIIHQGKVALTIINADAKKVIRLDAPTADDSRPSVWVGNQADGSDRLHADQGALIAADIHQPTPGLWTVFSACSAPNHATSGEYRRAYHSVVYEEG